MTDRKNARLSRVSFVFCAFLLLYSGSMFYPRWEKINGEAQLSWDASGYYWYLPSVFIYHDIKGQRFKDSIIQKYQPVPAGEFHQGFLHPSGHYVMKYSPGIAILEAPFFFVAHVLARPLGYPADGFSRPYQFVIYLGGIAFGLWGLWYLRKSLLCYYEDRVVAIVLLLLVLGTNYLNYGGIDVGMTHGWLFALYAFIIWNTQAYYRAPKKKYALRLGALIGITALVRPPEIISALIPLLWGMERLSVPVIKERARFFKKHIGHILPAALLCGLVLSVQFLYWKYATGRWFVYTYQDQGFSWLRPHFKKYAFNYQCGWLLYTPMMALALAGIPFFFRSGRNRVAILVMIALNYYIVAAWDAWDYGGRAMVQSYPVLLFPLASFVRFVARKKWRAFVALPFAAVFAYFNLWWTYQAHGGGLIGDVPTTKRYYFATIFRYGLPLDVQKLRDNEDSFEGTIKDPVMLRPFGADSLGDGALQVSGDRQLAFSFVPPARRCQWVRASADIRIGQKEWDVWYMTRFIVRFKKGEATVQENSIRLQRLLNEGEERNITIDARVRDQDYDRIEIVFLNDNNGEKPCKISRLKVIGFDD